MQSSAQLCRACAQLNIDALLKLPSVTLKHNHRGLPHLEWVKAILTNLPVFIPKPHPESDCPLCQLINKHLVTVTDSTDKTIAIYKYANFDDRIETLYLYLPSKEQAVLEITVYTEEDAWAAELLAFRLYEAADSSKSIDSIQRWLTHCNTYHKRCCWSLVGRKISRASPLPTRIVDVGDLNATAVRLRIPGRQVARYVTLSHCWGGISTCRTLRANLSQHQETIRLSELTKTVQDAVQLVRRLGLRYLWVDSLCIVQDDEEDWLREAGRMAAVYEGSYFTIAASASEDGSGGCFVSKAMKSLVRMPCDINDASKGFMYFGIKKDSRPTERLFDGPLNKRAWVLQEHLFARRTVHFAKDQIYWECDTYLMGQDGYRGRDIVELRVPMRAFLMCILGDWLGPQRLPHLVKDPPQDKFDGATYRSWWASMVKFYSTCGLTKASDKLPALISLSTELGKLTGEEYHEGHWLGRELPYSFFCSLLWCSNDEMPLRRALEHRAPSWSWASLDGALDFADHLVANMSWVFHPDPTEVNLLRIQFFQPCGLLARKSLFLSAVLTPATIRTACSDTPLPFPEDCMCCQKFKSLNRIRVSGADGQEIAGAFTFDTSEHQPTDFWLLAMYTRWVSGDRPAPVYFVLLVAEVANQKAPGFVFERIGVGHVEDARIVFGCEKRFLVLI